MATYDDVRFQGIHCTITVSRPGSGVVLVTFDGRDTGELGDAPLREIERDLTIHQRTALFIDARNAKAASMDVSCQWAQWLQSHQTQLGEINMLTGSPFIQLSAS